MTSKELALIALEMRERGLKDSTRTEGCPVWDKMSKDYWIRIINDELDEAEIVEESHRIMEHCKTCRHSMCIKATFGDVKPKVVGEDQESSKITKKGVNE